MKIFVINLENAKEKRKKMISILNSISNKYLTYEFDYEFDYEFFKAIDGKQLQPHEYNINLDWYNPCDNTHTTLGEVGCSISHYYLWKKIIDENIENAIILEDDVEIINPDFFYICKNINPSLYDVIYLSRKKMIDIPEESAYHIYPNLVKPVFSYWSCAYMLSKSGAKKLLHEYYINNIIAVDEYLSYIACYSNHFNNTSQKILEKSYSHIKNSIGDFNTFAFEPQLIKPNSKAFYNSSTFHSPSSEQYRNDITCITVGTDNNECCKRYTKSCHKYGANPIILGMGKKWLGGNMMRGRGGGHKINLLREYLNTIPLDNNHIIVFTDCYDVIMNNNINILIEKYKNLFDKKIVFAGETFCWPDQSLNSRYPNNTNNILTRYLNSGLFIGYSNDIKKILTSNIPDDSDDQLYYTHLFFKHNNITIDYNTDLFLCLNGLTDKINIDKSKCCLLYNNNRPIFIHGNGANNIKYFFNNIITNYCTGYNSIYGYNILDSNKSLKMSSKILFILREIDQFSNLEKWFSSIYNLEYNKDLISIIFVYKNYTSIEFFNSIFKNKEYSSCNVIQILEDNIWNTLIDMINNIDYDYIFYCKSNSIITNKNTLFNLLMQGKNIIAPLLVKPGFYLSNFWGDVANNGYYKRSSNYFDIINFNEKGCWNVPYIAETILIHKNNINKYNFTNIKNNIYDPDLVFCYNIRDNYNFMYILNTEIYGYIDNENIPFQNITLDSIINNRKEWETKYLNPIFTHDNIYSIHKDLGNDIHFLELFTPIFCKEIIELAENNGSWSKGGDSYYDNRINNIEKYPTRDIQLYDINLEVMWKKIIEYYIAPFMWKHYNFFTKEQNISFIVKYSLDGQRDLKPHHDSSSYTVNLCLNDDFSGGGCKFIKQDKIITNKKIGSLIIHPGRVTHLHEGLPITQGIRYILISFIN